MKKAFYIIAAVAVTAAAPAFAQDNSFNGGARIEARGGWDSVSASALGESGSKSGAVYGVEAGYDAVLSGFVLGAYAGIEGSSVKDCYTETTDRFCVKAGRNITVGARAGGRVGPGLLYVKGGYTNGRLTATYQQLSNPANVLRESGNADGFHVGGGYEMNVSKHVYVKAEYVFTKYSVDDDFGTDVDLHRHQVVAGIGLRF